MKTSEAEKERRTKCSIRQYSTDYRLRDDKMQFRAKEGLKEGEAERGREEVLEFGIEAVREMKR